jgi:DNA ligase-1
MSAFKPMLASKVNPAKLRFPLSVQPKLDGIRVCIVEGRALTRTLKEVPNREVFDFLSRPEFEGLDGEILVGEPTADDCYRKTTSFVMAPNKTGADWTFHVFDKWDRVGTFSERYLAADAVVNDYEETPHLNLVTTWRAATAAALEVIEQRCVAEGHEGVVVRDPDSFYKFGRASATVGELGKIKRFEDFEAEVIGVYEEQHNGNEAVTNALGRTERSSVQANKTGKGTLGGLILRGLNSGWEGVEFRCGTGFDHAARVALWADADTKHYPDLGSGNGLNGRVAKVKCFPIGVKDKPRHPVFLGWREAGA